MVRVLHVLNNLGSGGAENFVLNIYRNIDRSKVQFDFLIRSNQNGSMIDEIKQMGGNVYILPAFPRYTIKNYYELNRFLKNNYKNYVAIHVHANALIYVKPLQLAKKYGIPVRIIHSHSTSSKLRSIHYFNCKGIDRWITDRFACSDLAGQWMFPNKQYKIIPNGIDLERFAFGEKQRKLIRKMHKIESKTVIGHVGRFTQAKNHKFIISVFEEYHKENQNSVLLLIGDGVDKDKIKELVKKKGLEESVIFCGATTEVYRYYSAMDIFLFPSLFEGLPIVLVEAQANGLPCVISEKISSMVVMNDNVTVCSLQDGKQVWVEAIRELYSAKRENSLVSEDLKTYDVKNVTRELELFYTKQVFSAGVEG